MINFVIYYNKIISHLEMLGAIYEANSDESRAHTFIFAAQTIKDNFDTLPDNIHEIRNLKGIGPSVMKEIHECLLFGTSKRLELLQEKLENKA